MEPETPDPVASLTHPVAQPQIAELAAEWRDSLGVLRDAAAGAAQELASFTQGLGVAISRLRQAHLWGSDPDGVDRLLSSLAERLEEVRGRLEARALELDQAQRRASEAATSSIRRLGAEMQRMTAAPRSGGGAGVLADRLDDVEARLAETIQRSSRELHQHVSRGLAEAGGGWDVVLDGLAEVRKAVDQLRDAAPTTGEIAAMVPHAVEGLQERLAEAVATRTSSTAALSAKQLEGIKQDISSELKDLQSRLRETVRKAAPPPTKEELGRLATEIQAGLEERLATIEQAVRSVAASPEQPAATTERTKRTDAERQLATTTTALRKEIEAFRKRIEGWGKPRTAPRLAEEVQRLEGHVSELGRAVEEELAAKVARRVQASIDRRLRTLIGELPEHLRDTIAEAVHEAASASVAEVAREAVTESAAEAVRTAVEEALRQPATPAEGPSESQPSTEAGRRRLRFRR